VVDAGPVDGSGAGCAGSGCTGVAPDAGGIVTPVSHAPSEQTASAEGAGGGHVVDAGADNGPGADGAAGCAAPLALPVSAAAGSTQMPF
jgi:hypothetical protein